MTHKKRELAQGAVFPEGFPPLLETLRDLITQARQKVLSTANAAQVLTYWEIGRHIVEFEQGGETRAAYGKRLLADLAEALTREFGRGFDERNLRNMRSFFVHFPIRNALRSELNWTHYRILLRVDSAAARHWYSQEAGGAEGSVSMEEHRGSSMSYFGSVENSVSAACSSYVTAVSP